MADATDKTRATENRLNGDGSTKRPYVLLVPGTGRGFQALIVQPPEQIVFEEERPITPSKEFRGQDVRRQAESVLSKAAKGQHFKDDYLDKLQKQLGKAGGTDTKLAGAVGELRTSQRARDEARKTAAANRLADGGASNLRGRAPTDPGITGGTLPPEPKKPPPDDVEDLRPKVNAFLAGVHLVRRQFEARGLKNRYDKGERVSAQDAQRAATRLLEAGKQGGLYGVERGEFEQVMELGEIQLSQLRKAVGAVERGREGGARTDRKLLAYLGQKAVSAERQYQLLGVESVGTGAGLALRLADIVRAENENDARDVLDSAKRKGPSGPAYVAYLQQNLVGTGRQQQLLGDAASSDKALALAASLGTVPRVPLNQEARQVIDGLTSGQAFDDDYVEFLRRRLLEDAEQRGNAPARALAEALRDAEALRLESEVTTTLADAKSGKSFPDFYLSYLQKRLDDASEEEKSDERKSRWKRLASRLDDATR